jgi:hypothetical protein
MVEIERGQRRTYHEIVTVLLATARPILASRPSR